MNLVGLLAGDLVSGAAGSVAEKFIDKLMPSKAPDFLKSFQKVQESEDLSLSLKQLDLDREDELALMEMREHAMNRGIESMEIEIGSDRYIMNVKDFNFLPKV